MKNPTHAELRAEIAALRAVTETELKNLNARLSEVESTQKELVRVATQGRTGLRVLIWLGGFLAAAGGVLAAFWKDLSGH